MKNRLKKIDFISKVFRLFREWKILNSKSHFIETHGFYFRGSRQMIDGRFEVQEVRFFQREILNYDVFINVGANYGYYVCIALMKGKKVYAFEPSERNSKILIKNVLDNNLEEDFVFVPVALSDKSGLIRLYGSGTGASLHYGWNSQKSYSIVPSLTLNEFSNIFQRYQSALVMIDVEGFESSVLKGADDILSELKNVNWIVEITCTAAFEIPQNYRQLAKRAFEIFQKYGYQFKVIDSDEVTRLSYEDIYFQLSKDNPDINGHNFYFYRDL